MNDRQEQTILTWDRKTEVLIAPLAEGVLLLALSAVRLLLRLPLLFTSLGPTAYEQIEKPGEKSARPYNIVVGHIVGLACGFFGLLVFHAFKDAVPSTAGHLTYGRVFASVLGCALTALANLLLNASQPAAFSTVLLVTLGSYELLGLRSQRARSGSAGRTGGASSPQIVVFAPDRSSTAVIEGARI